MTYNNNVLVGVLAGALMGGLAGVVTTLLVTPQSGKVTRRQIQKKSIELRDQTAEMVEDTLKQIRAESKKLTRTGRDKATELIEQGQGFVAEQFNHVSDAALSAKKSIEHA